MVSDIAYPLQTNHAIPTFTVEMWNGVGDPNIGTMTVSYLLSATQQQHPLKHQVNNHNAKNIHQNIQ